jgi:hypothetical protein
VFGFGPCVVREKERKTSLCCLEGVIVALQVVVRQPTWSDIACFQPGGLAAVLYFEQNSFFRVRCSFIYE